MRRFRAPALPEAGGEVVLEEASSHHLLRVVGIGKADTVELFDGEGRRALATLERTAGGRAVMLAEAAAAPAPRLERWLLVALVKHEAFDLILRMATAKPDAGLPEAPTDLAAALALLPDGLARRVYTPQRPRLPAPAASAALLLGPEGGLTDAELSAALESGFEAEGLGERVLRADTAAAVALGRLL